MKLEDSHGGYHGKSLQEQIRDDLDQAYSDWKTRVEIDQQMHARNKDEGRPEDDGRRKFHCQQCFDALGDQYFAEGIAHALGVLRSTSADTEWEAAEERYANPVPAEVIPDDGPQVCCPDHKRPIPVLVVNETPDVDVFDPDDDFADNEFDEEFL